MAGKKITHSEEWWAAAPVHILRCTASYKDGAPCRREASPGTTVCGQHGALAPSVQARAAVRIQMTADDAAKRLVEWMNDVDVDMRERVKIAQDMLDRSGLAAVQKHLIGMGQIDPIEALFRDILADPNSLLDPNAPPPEMSAEQREFNRTADPDGLDWGDVVDAEIVDDPPSRPELPSPAPAQPSPAKPPKHIREAIKTLI